MSDIFEFGHDPIYPRAQPRDPGANQLGPFLVETTQRHTYGRRLITWDGKVYKYSKSSGVCRTGRGAKSLNVIGTVGIDYVLLPNTQSIGDRVITMTAAVAQAVNVLAGGQMIISDEDDDTPTDGRLQQRTIVRNTPCGAGETTQITLDYPLNRATTVATYAFCMPSPYNNVAYGEQNGNSIIGLPASYVSATGYHFWLQTFGPCWIASQNAVGRTANAREVVFRHDGSLDIHDDSQAEVEFQQHAGWIVDNNQGSNGGTVFMLELSI